MASIPTKRELTKRLADKPFTILGINTDEDRSVFKQRVAEHEVTWPNIFDGSTEGEVTSTWNIRSFPTGYLIDHEGVIIGTFGVYGGPMGATDQLDRTVEHLNELIAKIPG